jgi:hypothetical protein
MEWVWQLYRKYVRKTLTRQGLAEPSDAELETEYFRCLAASSVTVLVQEPWQNSVRFKGLARYSGTDMLPLLEEPTDFLVAHFGGGKFKLNFHEGWNFVATQNFKPEGEPLWVEMPGIDF